VAKTFKMKIKFRWIIKEFKLFNNKINFKLIKKEFKLYLEAEIKIIITSSRILNKKITIKELLIKIFSRYILLEFDEIKNKKKIYKWLNII
jgi:hypothetical protein